MATLLAYLEDPMFLDKKDGRLLKYGTKRGIQNLANDILVRLYPTLVEQEQEGDQASTPHFSIHTLSPSLPFPLSANKTSCGGRRERQLNIDRAHIIMDYANKI